MKSIIYAAFIVCIFGVMSMSCDTASRIKVVKLPVTSDPTISIKVWFKVGSQDDPEGKEGLASLTAAMISDGATKQRSYEKILEELYPLAAGYDAQVDKEMTVLNGRVHVDNLEKYYQLFKEALLEPAFAQDDFERIKSQFLNYLQRTLRYQNDEELGKEALSWFIFEETPYGHPEEGFIESVQAITVDDVRSFYEKFYCRNNLVVGIGGGYDETFISRLRADLATLPEGSSVQPRRAEAKPIEGLQVLLIEKETESTAISIGFPIDLLRADDAFHALWVANSWFGEHRNSSSHLYQVIREARGMNYGDYSYIENFPNGGARMHPPSNVARHRQIFQIWIRPVQNDARHFALRAAVRELQHLVNQGLTEEQFELTREFLSKYYLHLAETTSERLGYKLDDVFYGIKGNFLNDFSKKIEGLSLQEINAGIKRHLQYNNMKIVVVTRDASLLKEELIKNSASPMRYATPKPQAVLDEDKEIETYGLTVLPENVRIVKVEEMFLR